VASLVGAHRLHHGARALVLERQRFEVASEMLLDLAFGFGKESEIPAVAQQPCSGADGERARIP
jgi:hypothetical protein